MSKETNETNAADAKLAIELDREAKKQVAIDTVAANCHVDSEIEIFRRLAGALNEGHKLEAAIVAGGYTNFSYKVHVVGQKDTAVFVKIAFSRAIWNPTFDYDVQRTQNEFTILQRLAKVSDEHGQKFVATPYLCQDIDDMKVLVSEWAPGDELWYKQYLDGRIDTRIVPQVATALATLHSLPVDDADFNKEVRPLIGTVLPPMKAFVEAAFTSDDIKPNDRISRVVREYGKDVSVDIVENSIKIYHSERTCHIHGDSHSFNVLVEAKRKDGSFGDAGCVTLCDWEISLVGPIGFDLGFQIGFPITCLIWHARQGRQVKAQHILEVVESLWDHYVAARAQVEGKMNEEDIVRAYRSMMGWTGWFLFVTIHLLGLLVEQLNYPDGTREREHEKVREAAGFVGFKLMRWGFYEQDASSLAELRATFRKTLEEEMISQAAVASARAPRRLFGRRCSEPTIGITDQGRRSSLPVVAGGQPI